MLANNFNNTIDHWIVSLRETSFHKLCFKPNAAAWSMGQLYLHLINDTAYYIEQIKICLDTNDNTQKDATPFARQLFMNNDFSDELIEGGPSNALIPQPESKEQLMKKLTQIKIEMNHLAKLLEKSHFKGKTKRRGLGYFSAAEWFRFAEIHLRHHFRQKKRLDDFFETMS